MASSKSIVPAAALAIALATAALPAARAATPCCGTKMTPEMVAQQTLARYTEAGKQEQRILARVNRAGLWEGRESGGVTQLHPVRGTSLVPKDYAQQTLGEDWFLRPNLNNVALHLDVPYDAEVTVTYPYVVDHKSNGEEQVWVRETAPVRSRGRYRHLVLTRVPQQARHDVFVRATLWKDDPKCAPKVTTVCKKVQLQAGDRRHLTFPEQDFLAMVPPVTAFSAVAVCTQTCTTTTPPTTPSGFAFDDSAFPFKVEKDSALLAYAEYGAPGGTAKSFTFSKVKGHTPVELVVIHDSTKGQVRDDAQAEYKLELKFTWKTKDPVTGKDTAKPRSEVFTTLDAFKLAYKSGKGTAKVQFSGKKGTPPASTTTKEETTITTRKSATEEKTETTTVKTLPALDLRGIIETQLPGMLSDVDSPTEITVTGAIYNANVRAEIENSFKIIVK